MIQTTDVPPKLLPYEHLHQIKLKTSSCLKTHTKKKLDIKFGKEMFVDKKFGGF